MTNQILNSRFQIPDSRFQIGMAALPAILILTLVISVVGLALTGGILREKTMSVSSVESHQSFYLAESGTQDALLRIARNKNFTQGSSDDNITSVNELNVSVSETDSNTRTINSSSTVKGKQGHIKIIVNMNNYGQITSYQWQEQ